jgi:hypothetical protein
MLRVKRKCAIGCIKRASSHAYFQNENGGDSHLFNEYIVVDRVNNKTKERPVVKNVHNELGYGQTPPNGHGLKFTLHGRFFIHF